MYAQNAIGILCTDFKINNENTPEGTGFRRSTESVLSNIKNPPIIIDRDNLQDLIIKIQDEINLNKDLNISQVKELKAAKVDYVMYANFDKKLTSINYDLQIQCIRISGENAFSIKAFPIISFTEKELTNSEIFRKKLFEMFNNYAFTPDFDIIENKQLEEIKQRLDKKDQEIKNLNQNVTDLKNYSHVAMLNLKGVELEYGYDFTGWKTELYNLMESVLITNNVGTYFKVDESSLKILDEVILKYPNFPFGYSGMALILLQLGKPNWKEYANKALKILQVTIAIEGHNIIHDKVFQQLTMYLELDKKGMKFKFGDNPSKN